MLAIVGEPDDRTGSGGLVVVDRQRRARREIGEIEQDRLGAVRRKIVEHGADLGERVRARVVEGNRGRNCRIAGDERVELLDGLGRQGLAALGIAGAALTLDGATAGVAVVLLVAVLAFGRSACRESGPGTRPPCRSRG